MALTDDQLTALDELKQVRVRTRTRGGTRDTIIWIVVVDGVVYVRSVDGTAGHWYQRALSDFNVAILADRESVDFRAVHVDDTEEIDAVSAALRDKYPPGGSLDRMTRAEVLDTTLRLDPLS